MQAVLLAAGLGSRLGKLVDLTGFGSPPLALGTEPSTSPPLASLGLAGPPRFARRSRAALAHIFQGW
jgi:hypothetical protein